MNQRTRVLAYANGFFWSIALVVFYYATFGDFSDTLFWIGFGGVFISLCLLIFDYCILHAPSEARGVGSALLLIGLAMLLKGAIPLLRFPDMTHMTFPEAGFLKDEILLEGGTWQPGMERLLNYPVSFLMNFGLGLTTGADFFALIHLGLLLAIPLFALNSFVFFRVLFRDSQRAILALFFLLCLPFVGLNNLVYDGYAFVMLPLGFYLFVKLTRKRSTELVLIFIICSLAIALSHFLTSVFFVIAIVAIALACWLSGRKGMPSVSVRPSQNALVFVLCTIAAWLTYVSVVYMSEGIGLVQAVLQSVTTEPLPSEGQSLVPSLDAIQLTLLVGSLLILAVWIGNALRDLWVQPRTGGDNWTHFVALGCMIATLVPVTVVFLIPLTQEGPLASAKEFKVRFFLYAATFVAATMTLGYLRPKGYQSKLRHTLHGREVFAFLCLILLLNTLTLPLSYGLSPSYLYPRYPLQNAENPQLETGQLLEYGIWVGRFVSPDSTMVASWNERVYMIGYGNVSSDQVITSTFAPYARPNATLPWMLTHGADFISVDSAAVQYPSIYWGKPVPTQTVSAIDTSASFNAVYDNGRNVLYALY